MTLGVHVQRCRRVCKVICPPARVRVRRAGMYRPAAPRRVGHLFRRRRPRFARPPEHVLRSRWVPAFRPFVSALIWRRMF